jgi:hypothetical protein
MRERRREFGSPGLTIFIGAINLVVPNTLER